MRDFNVGDKVVVDKEPEPSGIICDESGIICDDCINSIFTINDIAYYRIEDDIYFLEPIDHSHCVKLNRRNVPFSVAAHSDDIKRVCKTARWEQLWESDLNLRGIQ